MECQIKITEKYLGIPVSAEQPQERLEMYLREKKIFEFMVPVDSDAANRTYDYYGYINVEEYKDQEITLKGNFDEAFFRDFTVSAKDEREPIVRPLMHLTAERGWMNDPNGLVYHDGVYHVFFQHNPLNTVWQNMTWAHHVSKDLLHFERWDDALYPDEYGTEYSGCGIVNEKGLLGLPEDALLFYYTAAGGNNEWSKGVEFTQRIAYSTDGGRTLHKLPKAAVEAIDHGSRDPKVFWHEESGAYGLVLWLRGNEFGFFRSTDLQNWEMTDSQVLGDAYECPNFDLLDCEGEKFWMFADAGGYYYVGKYDGYKFTHDGVQRNAYANKLPYAAQSFSGTEGRVVNIPWLRTANKGKLYTSMMGLPREMKLVKRNGETLLSMLPVREYEDSKEKVQDFAGAFETEVNGECVTEIALKTDGAEKLTVGFFGECIEINGNQVSYKGNVTETAEALTDIHIIIDREIVEIHANDGTRNLYYETASDVISGKISIAGTKVEGTIYRWQP